MSYSEALKEARHSYSSGGSIKSDYIRHIIYRADKFNPSKMQNPSEFITSGKHYERQLDLYDEDEMVFKFRKFKSDMKQKQLDELSKKQVKPKANEANKEVNEAIERINAMNTYLNSGRKHMFKTDEQVEMFKDLVSAVRGFDYYPTPEKYSQLIYNDVKEWYGNEFNDIKILDVACGLLSLSMPFIQNGNEVHLNEFNQTFAGIIKPFEKLKNVSLTVGDFFELPENHYFKKDINVIIMNPPFSGSINGKSDNKIYLYFIIKAIDILYNSKLQKYDNYSRFLYVICPKTCFKNVKAGDYTELNIPNTVIKQASKLFDIDYLDDITPHITFMSDVDGFRTIRNGKPTELKATFGMYKFEVL
jgi:predicted RNA methylase